MNDKEKIFDGMTQKQIISRCGELQLPHEQLVLLVSGQHPVDRKKLLNHLESV